MRKNTLVPASVPDSAQTEPQTPHKPQKHMHYEFLQPCQCLLAAYACTAGLAQVCRYAAISTYSSGHHHEGVMDHNEVVLTLISTFKAFVC